MLALEGVASARRMVSPDGETFIAIYELDADVEAVRAALSEAQASGTMSAPKGLRFDPPPVVRYFQQF
jgi:hypothetical protein